MDRQPQPVAPQPPVEPRPSFNEVSVLFPLLSLVTVAYLAMLIAEFVLPGALHVPAMMMPVYIALLGAYAADKEIRRWAGAALSATRPIALGMPTLCPPCASPFYLHQNVNLCCAGPKTCCLQKSALPNRRLMRE
jgi:hypothetical protein